MEELKVSTDGSLLIRQRRDERFVRAITCAESALTVIIPDTKEQQERFYKAFCSNMQEVSDIDIRIGSRCLLRSEVCRAGVSSFVNGILSVNDVVRQAGYAKSEAEKLIARLGLSDKAENQLDSLTASERRRLLLVCSLSFKNRVIFFNEPFEGMEREWVCLIASLMEESVRNSGQCYVVLSSGVIPKGWDESPLVLIESLGSYRSKTSSFGGSGFETIEVVKSVRSLLKNNQLPKGSLSSLCFRPQTVYFQGVCRMVEDALKTENIVNPDVHNLIKSSVENGSAAIREGVVKRGKKGPSSSGPLTRLTWKQKVARMLRIK